MKKSFCISFVLIFTVSCNNLVTVQKRKHLSGYYISFSNPKKEKTRCSVENENYKKNKTANSLVPDRGQSEEKKLRVVSEENPGKKGIPPLLIASDHMTRSQHAAGKRRTQQSEITVIKNLPAHNIRLNCTTGSMPVAERRTSSNAIFLFFSGLLMALTIFSFLPSFSRPNKLSFWAKNNSRKAQGIILTSHAAIGTFGLYLGNKLTEHEIITSDISTNLLFGLASVTTFLYPVRNVFTGLFKTSHKKQKLFSLLLTLSGFLLLVNVGNRSSAEKDFSPVTASLIYEMTAYEVVPGFSNQASNAVTYNNTNAPKYEPWEIVGNVLLTILALVGFLALLYIVAFFTCALACNGQEALSATVAITGGTLSVYLLIIAFKAIWKKNNNETTLESMKLPETV